MSDLCLYELQDNVWDEFNESDDHIVPKPADDTGDKCTIQSDNHKKLKVEASDATRSADCRKKLFLLGKREASSQNLRKRDKMLSQCQWHNASDGEFASSEGDTVNKSMVSNDSTITDNCFKGGNELCAGDSMMRDPSMSVDNNLYDYHLSQISQSESSLNFFDDGDRESSDLYYGWPDIGNFEDVDKMFSCDSAYRLRSLSNDDDLGWFSSSTAIEGPEDALRSRFKISCSESTMLRSDLENDRDYGPQREDNSVNESRKKFMGSYYSLSSQSTCLGDATSAANAQLVNGSEMKCESKKDSVLQEICKFISADYCHQVSQISECPSLPSINCVNDNHLSPSSKESSHASNQGRITDPNGSSFEVPNGKNDETARQYNHQQLQASIAGSLGHLGVKSPAAISDPVAVLKKMHQNVNDSDDHSEVGVKAGVAMGLDKSLAQDASSMSSMVDEISLEATSFCQLQQVMEKLDIRTKLCIRDSLYRLARSAEQRHNCLTPDIACKNEGARDGDIIVDDSNKCTASYILDMETDTNPIDRSVAHLLFHRPKDIESAMTRPTPRETTYSRSNDAWVTGKPFAVLEDAIRDKQ